MKTWNQYLNERRQPISESSYFSPSGGYANGAWPKHKAKLIALGMPKAVQQVAQEAYQSAIRGTKMAKDEIVRMYGPGGSHESPKDLRYWGDIDYTGDVTVSYFGVDDHLSEPENTWEVARSTDDSRMKMRFFVDDGKWYYYGYYGKKPMPGGQREAMSNAELMFHG